MDHHRPSVWKRVYGCCFVLLVLGRVVTVVTDSATGHLSIPNRNTGNSFERLFGITVAHPYPYYQKPMYRYPVYDAEGRGRLLYGYGGPETFQYKKFTPIEGHH